LNKNNFRIVDGQKSIPLNSLPEEAWRVVSGDTDDSVVINRVQRYYSTIGILNRCISIRANSFAAIPWSVSKGGTQLYSVGEGALPLEIDWLRGMRRMLYLFEASLLLYSRSYALIDGFLPPRDADPSAVQLAQAIVGAKPSLRWMQSSSITPVWDFERGIVGFKRTLSRTQSMELPIERVCFFDIPNPTSETLAAPSPVAAALKSADVLFALDTFAEKFIERGAIKATLLRIDQTTPPREREKIKNWWGDFVQGMKNAWTSEVLSNAVEPIVIGEGLTEVVDPEITRAKAEDIATTLGIPHSLVFSDSANRATSQTDERNLYTHALVPDSELIEEEINYKLFEPLGLNFSFEPESLRVYQENEKERADTYQVYVGSGMPVSIAVQIAGVELPDGLTPDMLEQRISEQKLANIEMARTASTPDDGAKPPDGESNSKADKPREDDGKADEKVPSKQPQSFGRGAPPFGAKGGQASKELLFDEQQRFIRWAKNRLERGDWSLSDFSSETLSNAQKGLLLSEVIESSLPRDTLPVVFWEHDSEAAEKAMVLQIDPDDDDAEQRQMDKVEATMTRKLGAALSEQKAAVFEGNENRLDSDPSKVNIGALLNADARVESISGANGSARDALRAALVEGVDLGVRMAIKQFDTVGFGFNWTLANEQARDWADKHSLELIKGIDETTKRSVRQQIAQWVANGEPLSVLSRELETIFGKPRASLVASTEVTRAYAEGNRVSYKESGIVKKVRWRTTVAERVCPICGALHDKTAGIDVGWPGSVRGGFPPAHPRCRCWIVPVIEKQNILGAGVLNDTVGGESTAPKDE
jgi:SPP1 gp7 family putative phage head morphogenesis protein